MQKTQDLEPMISDAKKISSPLKNFLFISFQIPDGGPKILLLFIAKNVVLSPKFFCHRSIDHPRNIEKAKNVKAYILFI